MYMKKQCPNQRHMGMLWQCTVSAEIVDIVECKVHVYVYICMALMKEPYHTVIWVMELSVKVHTKHLCMIGALDVPYTCKGIMCRVRIRRMHYAKHVVTNAWHDVKRQYCELQAHGCKLAITS